MRNKPNFRKAKMNLTFYSTKDYENKPPLRTPGKQTQSNPISKGTLARSGGQPFRMMPRASLQLNGPVGVVEELLPASVAGLAKVDADKRIVLGLDGWVPKVFSIVNL